MDKAVLYKSKSNLNLIRVNDKGIFKKPAAIFLRNMKKFIKVGKKNPNIKIDFRQMFFLIFHLEEN